MGRALVSGDKLAVLCLVGILGIIGAGGDGLGDGFALVYMKRFYPGRRQKSPPFKAKCTVGKQFPPCISSA